MEGSKENDYAFPLIKRVLFTEKEIQAKIEILAKAIDEHYKDKTEPLVLVGVLKGAFMFMSDLTKRLNIPHQVEFISVSSYGHGTTSSGNVRMLMDVRQDLVSKHIILVEDIVDTGITLDHLFKLFKTRKAASVECAVFLKKKRIS